MNHVIRGAIALSAVFMVASCSSTGSQGFWSAASIDALEADQPTSAAELADRSEVVVRGTITNVEEGPIDNPAYAGDDFPIVAVEITITQIVDGSYDGDTIKVIMPRQPTVSVESMKSMMPDEEVLAFVVDSGVEDYYATFSDLSMITTINNTVETALDPESTEIVAQDADTLDEVVDVVEEAIAD